MPVSENYSAMASGRPGAARVNACREKIKLGLVASASRRSICDMLGFHDRRVWADSDTMLKSAEIRRSEASHLIGPDATLVQTKQTPI